MVIKSDKIRFLLMDKRKFNNTLKMVVLQGLFLKRMTNKQTGKPFLSDEEVVEGSLYAFRDFYDNLQKGVDNDRK